MLAKTVESPLDSKVIIPVNPQGNQHWIYPGRTDTEPETPILWPPDAKSWLTGKDLMLGKIEGKRRRGWQMKWLDGIINSMDMDLSKFWEMVKDREAWCAVIHGIAGSDMIEGMNNHQFASKQVLWFSSSIQYYFCWTLLLKSSKPTQIPWEGYRLPLLMGGVSNNVRPDCQSF